MLQIYTDANSENYPSYVGWEVYRIPQLHKPHKPHKFCEDVSEQALEPADQSKSNLKSESASSNPRS